MERKMEWLKWLGMGAATAFALGAAGPSFGQALVDDMEGGNSFNRFGGMWSFSGDFWDKGNSKILSAVDTSLAIPFFKGAYGGGFPDGTGNAAKLHFRFGTTRPGTPPNTYDNNVNMTAPFGSDDAVLNLTGAASFSFYARSDKNLQVEVVLPTLNITDWAYYSAMITVTPAWTKHTIKLGTSPGGLTRRNFGTAKPLDLTQALGLQWEVNKGKNASVTEAVLWIDDVQIQGYTWVAPEPRGSCMVTGCLGAPGRKPSPAALVSDFEGADPTANKMGLAWSYFSSVAMNPDARPNIILGGVDSLTSSITTAGKGFAGNGAWLDFALGETWFAPEGHLLLPAVSLTMPMTMDTGMDATGSTGLYFDYKTTGSVEYVDLRVRTDQVHAENIYAVAYVKLKGTGGQWKGAEVKWSDFILPNWGPAFREAEKTMSFNRLMGVEWSVTSAKKDVSGGMAVDNVHLLGLDALPQDPSAIHAIGRAGQGRIHGQPASRGAWIRRGMAVREGEAIRLDGRHGR